jgi:hypothetical protein
MCRRVKVEGSDEAGTDGGRVIRARGEHGPGGGTRGDS